jgi:hypothetical protein
MTNPLPYALAFEAQLSIGDLLDRLNAIGPWRWRLSDSDTYGESVWTMPDRTRVFRISPDGPRWVLQFDTNDPAREPFDRLFHDTIFPALGAVNVYPTEAVR